MSQCLIENCTAPDLSVLPKGASSFIDGEYVTKSSGKTIEHIYPATGQATTKVHLGGAKEIDEAIRTSREAQRAWRYMIATERRDILQRFAASIIEHGNELGMLQVLENGMASGWAFLMPLFMSQWTAYYAGWADKLGGSVCNTYPTELDYVLDEPYGVVGTILPFNVPILQLGFTLGAALATGNCYVAKPSSLTPFTTLRIAELAIEAGVPSGVFNVVVTDGAGGNILCSHPGIDKIHMTGSAATARQVMAAAAQNLTPVAFELGGKSAMVFFNDADLSAGVPWAVAWSTAFVGQACVKGSRLLVQSGIYDEVVEQVKKAMLEVAVGDPYNPATNIGPISSAKQCEEVMGYIQRAKKSGKCKLAIGGDRVSGNLSSGYFVLPTIFTEVEQDAEVYTEEVFGPVMTITKFETEEDAVRMVNDSRYGLSSYLVTSDMRRAMRLAPQIEAGTVQVNELSQGTMNGQTPFGGYKQSGFGKVGGHEGIREFLRTKLVTIPHYAI